MKITAIKQQVRRPERYSIYVDDDYAFSLSDRALLDSKLVPGQDLQESEVRDWRQRSDDDKSYDQALRYVALRPHSTWEVEQYLLRKKNDPLLCQKILSKLSELRLLDDTAFAENWVANRRLLKPISRRKLSQELQAKRVASDIVTVVLAADPTDDATTLRQMIAKKRQQTRYQDVTKLMQYLARQGYSYDAIKQAMADDTSTS